VVGPDLGWHLGTGSRGFRSQPDRQILSYQVPPDPPRYDLIGDSERRLEYPRFLRIPAAALVNSPERSLQGFALTLRSVCIRLYRWLMPPLLLSGALSFGVVTAYILCAPQWSDRGHRAIERAVRRRAQ